MVVANHKQARVKCVYSIFTPLKLRLYMTIAKLAKLLRDHALTRIRPDNSRYKALLLADEHAIAELTGTSLLSVECAALKENIIPERYSRNQKSLSCRDQLKLLQAHVAIIGVGGLGGAVAEILARTGIGALTLVDGDRFEESNLNRQIISTPSLLGKSKAKCAAERVTLINPAIFAHPVEDFLTSENGGAILAPCRLAVDCLDTISARFTLEKSCKNLGIPLVSAAIGGGSGHAIVIYPGDPGLQMIYGKEEKHNRPGIEATIGTLCYTALFMAGVQCAAVTAILLDRKSPLRNTMLMTDVHDLSCDLIVFEDDSD